MGPGGGINRKRGGGGGKETVKRRKGKDWVDIGGMEESRRACKMLEG